MNNLEWIVPTVIVVIGAIVHIEVNLAILKNDIKWIKRQIGISVASSKP